MTDDSNQGSNRQATNPGNQVGNRFASWLGAVFYTLVAVVALAGQTGAATTWLHWPTLVALPAVAALELGGITLEAIADHRRRLGERALAARLLSAAVATWAVAFNWFGHGDHLVGGFFAGMSGLGFLVWLIQAGNRRRDHLRAAGMLPPVPPAYPLWQWLRHPAITARARQMALADTTLGLYPSLQLAASTIRTERREAAIARLLRRELAKGNDRLAAEIASTTYDLEEIASRLRDRADYDGLTDVVARRLLANRLLNQRAATGTTPVAPVAQAQRRPAIQATAEPATTDEATIDRSATTPEPVTQPVTQPATGRRHGLRLVAGEPAAVTNARIIRQRYGNQLPSSDRQIRRELGNWSHKRVVPALEAYHAGLDLQADAEQHEEREATG